MPVEQPPLIPGAGPRPFRTRDDVLKHLDVLLREGDVAPIRDALLDALTALLFELQYRSEYAIAQADLLRATEGYLTSLGGDDRMVPRSPEEQGEPYRTRLLATPLTVTEEAITLGVNIILAPFTSTRCELFDAALDRWFVGIGDAAQGWHSFIGAPPEYPDRLFSGQEASNDGFSRPFSDPGGARVFNQTLGRQFILRLPDLGALAEPSYVGLGDIPVNGALYPSTFFVGTTVDPQIAAFVNPNFAAPLSLYRAIESFVNSVIGQSIRWGFFAELEAA